MTQVAWGLVVLVGLLHRWFMVRAMFWFSAAYCQVQYGESALQKLPLSAQSQEGTER